MRLNVLKISHIILAAVVILNLGLLIYWGGQIRSSQKSNMGCGASSYSLINQSLACDISYALEKGSYTPLNNDLVKYIVEQNQKGTVSQVSIYLRDLYNGPVLEIDSNEKFSPASLLKLPLLITILDLAEEKPEILTTQLVYTPPENEINPHIVPFEQIEGNVPYTVDDLLHRMVKYSDNRAYYAVLEYLRELSPDEDLLLQTYINLGIVDPDNLFDETVSTRSYASIFHQLFHSSYFSHLETSQKALEYLIDADFRDGLVAGVPEHVKVAHKFGERIDEETQAVQLHDCGIIYFQDNPYSLCIMTRGDDIDDLKSVIAEISKRVYEEFESRAKE